MQSYQGIPYRLVYFYDDPYANSNRRSQFPAAYKKMKGS
ncbi:hypothetical protein QSI_2701 [Clostridioides difficile P28]|nr:hypothetical protein QSI_2701 [Clostridioides difficile P28]